MNSEILLAYFGDDFTGSTDALEFLTRAGTCPVLFTKPPTPSQLARFPNARAIGVAGLTRSMSPDAMERELRPAFSALRALRPRHVHYKVCSTFDSSPAVGSIGRAIDIGAEIFGARFIPLLAGAPALGRHCVFGNLFARMGIGSTGGIHRLDRHPSMSRHPVTPADESDLRLHLAKQTAKRVALFDVLKLALEEKDAAVALEQILGDKPDVVLFDALYLEHMQRLGALIDAHAPAEQPLFSVGSSGIEMALGAHWAASGLLSPIDQWPSPASAEPLLIASGSCSPVTAAQIDWALANGFVGVALSPDGNDFEIAREETIRSLRTGRSTVVFTSRGEIFRGSAPIPASTLGSAIGVLVRKVLEQIPLQRVLLAGGDTSSFAAHALGIESIEMIAPLAPGAPLCRVVAPGSPADQLEFNFKGGQVGAPDYFGAVARGKV